MRAEAAPSAWAQSRERGAYVGIRFMFALYRIVGRVGFRVVLVPVIIYFFLVNRRARRASLSFLHRVHEQGGGPWPQDVRPGWRQSFHHFMTFGEAVLDKAAAWSGAFQTMKIRYDGRDYLEAWQREGRGAVLFTSHLGNIEVCRALSRERTKLRLNVLVHTRHAENFNRLLRSVDGDVGVRLVEVTDFGPAMAALLQSRVDAGEFVVVAADRTPVSGGRAHEAVFLGERASFPIGGAMIAAVLRCPVAMLTAVRDGKAFRMIIEPLTDFRDVPRSERSREIDHVVDMFAERLTGLASAYPYQWFNFYDFWQKAESSGQDSQSVANHSINVHADRGVIDTDVSTNRV